MKPALFLIALSFCIAQAASPYQRIEETVAWENHGLSNPFTGTELRLTVTAPASRLPASRFEFYGFFDGDGGGGQSGGKWKFRILADAAGEWRVRARFVEPGTDTPKPGAPAERNFVYSVSGAPPAGENGHIRIDPRNGFRLAHANGKPWVPFPIQASMLLDQESQTARQWVDAHAALGVNAMTVRFHSEANQGLGIPGWFHYLLKTGQRTSSWPGSPGSFDYTRFDLATWRHNEDIIEYCRTKDVKLSVWFGISGLNSQYWSYGPKDYPNDNTLGPQQKLFIRYFLARWAAYTNWWHWTIDSEYEEAGDGALARNRAYAAEMRASNPWGTLLTTHVLSNWSPGTAPEFDFATLQMRVADTDGGATDSRTFIAGSLGFGKPVYNSEGVWNLSNSTRIRIATMAHLMAGGFSHVASDASDARASSWGASWNTVSQTHKDWAAVTGRLAGFFNKTPGLDINPGVPRQDLITVSGGRPGFCLAAVPDAYYVWVSEGGSPTLDLRGVSGTFSVSRWAGATGAPQSLPTVSGGGHASLGATPSTGFGNDYFYVIKATSKPKLTIVTPPQLYAYVGRPFSQTLTAQNANGPVTWSRVSGAFPPGIALSGNVLSGTTSSTGSYAFALSARDADTTVSREFTLQASPPAETDPPVFSNVKAVNQTGSSVTLTWSTNEPASSRAQWGDAPGNYTGESGVVATGVTSHSVTLSDDFAEGERVHVLLISADGLGNTGTYAWDFQVRLAQAGIALTHYSGSATAPIVAPSLVNGTKQAQDRSSTWSQVPAELASLPYLLTSRGDKNHPSAADAVFYRMSASVPSTVYALVDGTPEWLAADGWIAASIKGPVTDGVRYQVHRKDFAAGTMDLKRFKSGASQGTSYVFRLSGQGGNPPPPPPPGAVSLDRYSGDATPPRLFASGLNEGALQAVDRTSTWSQVPAELVSKTYLATARDDKYHDSDEGAVLYTLSATAPVTVYALVDGTPAWLAADGWTASAMTGPVANDVRYNVYVKEYPAGTLGLKRFKNSGSQGTAFAFRFGGG